VRRKKTGSPNSLIIDEAAPAPFSAIPLADLMAEPPLLASKLASEREVDTGTVGRWMFNGCKSKSVNGTRTTVKLEYYRIGGRLYTSRPAFERFVRALNGHAQDPATPPSGRSTGQRQRASDKAGRVAEELGC
jgi:hypothetical protein